MYKNTYHCTANIVLLSLLQQIHVLQPFGSATPAMLTVVSSFVVELLCASISSMTTLLIFSLLFSSAFYDELNKVLYLSPLLFDVLKCGQAVPSQPDVKHGEF